GNTIDALGILIFGVILLAASMLNTIFLIWWERKLLGRFMDRRGAMHVGYAGLLQNFADGFKLFRKDTVRPRDADSMVFFVGPTAYLVTSLVIFAILPISTGWNSGNLPLSLLLAITIFSFAPLFIFISAWSSNNKYSLIGGMRSAAQMIAYEVPILLAIVAVVIVSGTFSLDTIVTEQQNYWYWGPLFLAMVVFVTGMLAEMERIPFDLPEAEAELVEGWNTEYGGMMFAYFMLTDYV
ncbi:NADH:ubiquinone oxidoreductase, subunit 1, partial [mine drainage metagenome]